MVNEVESMSHSLHLAINWFLNMDFILINGFVSANDAIFPILCFFNLCVNLNDIKNVVF